MGGPASSSTQWSSYTTQTNVRGQSTAQIYTSRTIKDTLDPKKFEVRESRDNVHQPETTPIIVGLDVTGSMSHLLKTLAEEVGTFASSIFEKDIVKDPQIMLMGIGDVKCDDSPIQVTQFESDIRIAEQLKEIYFEGGGGGNGSESYPLAWYVASKHTVTDAFEKRNKKGILITIGNDGLPKSILGEEIKKFLGYDGETVSTEDLYSMVSKKYEVFHIHMSDRHGYTGQVKAEWEKVIGDRLVVVDDATTVPAVMIALCMKLKGMDEDEIVATLGSANAKQIASAVKSVAVVDKASKSGKLKRF